MKKSLITLLILSGLIFSCSLETEPEDFTSSAFYFRDDTELNYALNGVYDVLSIYAGPNLPVLSVADQMFYRGAGRTSGPDVYNFEPSDANVSTLWESMYQGIERANVLLANINKVEMNEEQKFVIKGEAKFLRAYYYFLLVQNFGSVPLKTDPSISATDISFPNTPFQDIYQFIYSEMVEAEGMVKSITDYNHAGRITKSAVQGILARVSLFMAGNPTNLAEKYEDALFWSEQVIGSGNHELNSDYPQVFINMVQNLYDTKESIWEVEFYTTGSSDPYGESGRIGMQIGIQQNNTELGYSAGQYYSHEILRNKFESQDIRKDWTIATYYFNNKGEKNYLASTDVYKRYPGKFRREYELVENKIKNDNGTNFPLLRYSDVLLMAAEAENEISGATIKAHQYLNEVRERANASPINGITSKDQFRGIIQDERYRELSFEGQRKFDLIRWGIFISKMKALAVYINSVVPDNTKFSAIAAQNVSEKHLLLPIPQKEISLNKSIKQNPGW